jgi:hypothetical protein
MRRPLPRKSNGIDKAMEAIWEAAGINKVTHMKLPRRRKIG